MKSIETAMPTAQVDEILYENGIRYFDDYYNLDNYTEIRCPDGCLYIETKDLTKRIIKKLERRINMSVTLIMGASGSGKSTAIRTLPEDKTLVISISKGTGKSLPFKGWKTKYSKEKGNFIIKSSATELIALLTTLKNKAPKKFKYIVIDDVQYVMAFDFLRRAKESGFNKFVEMGQAMVEIYDLLASFEDVHCFMLQHTEDIIIDGIKNTKAKTLGKLIDDKITWEGLFTIVLQTEVLTKEEGREYTFKTQNNGDSTAKSPLGMFDTVNIPNDLLLVANTIEQYDN